MRDRSLSFSPSMSRWTERSFLTVASSSPLRLDNDFPSACKVAATTVDAVMLYAHRQEGRVYILMCARRSAVVSPARTRRGPHAPAGVLLPPDPPTSPSPPRRADHPARPADVSAASERGSAERGSSVVIAVSLRVVELKTNYQVRCMAVQQ